MQISADDFAVQIVQVSPDYELGLLDLQSSDAKGVAFRDTTFLDFNK